MQTVNLKTNIIQIINDDDSDPLFERKIQNATDGLNHDCFTWLYEKVAKFSKGNAAVIADYIMSMKTETNLSDNYRRAVIILLTRFSIFFSNQKTFKSMTRDDILKFLDSFRKIESVDITIKLTPPTPRTSLTICKFFILPPPFLYQFQCICLCAFLRSFCIIPLKCLYCLLYIFNCL